MTREGEHLQVSEIVHQGAAHTSARRRSPPLRQARDRASRRGLTLVEVTVAVAVAATATAVAVAAVNSLTNASLHSTAIDLTGAIKFCYDRAIMERRTERLSIDMDKGLWWIDFTDEPFSLSRERLSGREGDKVDPTDEEGEEDRPSTRRSIFQRASEDEEVNAALEGGQAIRFAPDSEVSAPKAISPDVRISKVWTGHQEEAFTSGVAHIHFFSGGWTEPAQIELTDGDEFVTLKIYPLTGRVRTYDREIETQKPDRDDGREEGDE